MKIQSINNFERINISKKQADEPSSEVVTAPSLSTPKTMQAFKAYAVASPNFKNLSIPIEATDKYNKIVEGKDHLDLPNIHVYEYPDTNLRVFVNSDENLSIDNQLFTIFLDSDVKNYNFVKSKLLYFIINSKLEKNINLEGDNFAFSCSSLSDTVSLTEIKKANKILTNLTFNNDELDNAKQELIKYLNSTEYKDSIKISKSVYKNDELKENIDITNEIQQITMDDLNKYYKDFKEHSNIDLYITVSSNKFENNKSELLKLFNSEILGKFKKSTELSDNTDIVINKQNGHISNDFHANSLYYPVKYETIKDDFLGHISACILNELSDDFEISSTFFPYPIELKNSMPLKHHNCFYSFKLKHNEINLEELCNNSNFEELFKITKQYYKQRLKDVFTNNHSIFIKHFELISYSEDILKLYETLDSITEDDVKQYIKTYFVKQQPIAEIEGEK